MKAIRLYLWVTHADFTQEYFYGEKYGMGIILAGGNAGIGRYEMT